MVNTPQHRVLSGDGTGLGQPEQNAPPYTSRPQSLCLKWMKTAPGEKVSAKEEELWSPCFREGADRELLVVGGAWMPRSHGHLTSELHHPGWDQYHIKGT